jgi:hypothetical protein
VNCVSLVNNIVSKHKLLGILHSGKFKMKGYVPLLL